MASINIKVKSDFAQASKDLKSFGNVTAAEAKRVETYLKNFKAESIDKFIDKNRRLGAGMKANKGDISAIITQQKALEKQSINLIAKGLDPEDDAIEKLNDEYNRLQKEYDQTVQASKGMEAATKAAQKALLGIGVATVAGAATFIKLASSVEMVEASFTPLLGSTEKAEELVSKLNATAATTPFQFENIAAASKQLLPVMNQDIEKTVETFRMLGDTAGGNAQKLESITRGYTKAMLKNKVDMESLNMIAEAGVPIYTELAKSLNVSVAEMTKMSSAGEITSSDLTTAFEQMTAEGGLFFEGMEIASATAEGKLSTVKDIFKLIGATIGSDLLPAWKGFLDKLIESGTGILKFIQDGDKLNKTLEIAGIALASATAGLASFLIATKAATAINTLTTAFAALKIVLTSTAGIIGLVATAIVAVTLAVKNLRDERMKDLESSFENISDSLGKSNKELNTIAIAFKSARASGIDMESSLDRIAKQYGVSKDELALILSYSQNLSKEDAKHFENIKAKNELYKDMDAYGKAYLENQKKVILAEEESAKLTEAEVNARLQLYVDQNERVQEILKNNRTEKELKEDQIKLIDDQIASITELSLADSTYKDDQLAAVEILKAKKQKILDDEVEATKTAEELKLLAIQSVNDKWTAALLMQSDDKLALLEIEKDEALKQAEEVGADTTLIHKYYEKEKTRITEEENDKKEADTKDMIAKVTGYVDQGFAFLESLATKATLSFSDLGNAVTIIGDIIGNEIVSVSGKAISASSNIIEEIIANAEALQTSLIDLSNDTYSQMLSNRKALIDQTYDLEAERISDTYNLELETIRNTLSEAELLQLQSLGIIEETKAEANETARREALQAAADAGTVSEAQIKAINDVYDARKTAMEDQEAAEAAAATATAQYQYDNAVFQKRLAVAQATINKDEALSALPWYTSAEKRNELETNYDSLISSISSAPLPANPSAQTGTPMGGFQVPENTGSSRADNTSINVSPNEVVSVTPRGEGGNSQNIIVQIDRETIFSVIKDGLGSGDIIINTDNIQSA